MSNLAFLVLWPLLEKGRLPGTTRVKEQPAVAALGPGICAGLKCRQNAAGACPGTPSPLGAVAPSLLVLWAQSSARRANPTAAFI